MRLQSMEAGELLSRWRVYPAADVDALLARIRAAVEAERAECEVQGGPFANRYMRDCRATLDALLADGGA